MNEFNRKNHLKKIHEERKSETNKKVDKGINYLLRNEMKINFNSVSKVSNVSKSTLYKRSKIRNRIENLRLQQSQVNSPSEVKTKMNNDSKDAIISSLKRKIKKLKKENEQLNTKIKDLNKQLNENFEELYNKI